MGIDHTDHLSEVGMCWKKTTVRVFVLRVAKNLMCTIVPGTAVHKTTEATSTKGLIDHKVSRTTIKCNKTTGLAWSMLCHGEVSSTLEGAR